MEASKPRQAGTWAAGSEHAINAGGAKGQQDLHSGAAFLVRSNDQWFLLKVLAKPGCYALNHVMLMSWIGEDVVLMLVDNQLGLHPEGLEGMPELIRLGRGTFTVAIA